MRPAPRRRMRSSQAPGSPLRRPFAARWSPCVRCSRARSSRLRNGRRKSPASKTHVCGPRPMLRRSVLGHCSWSSSSRTHQAVSRRRRQQRRSSMPCAAVLPVRRRRRSGPALRRVPRARPQQRVRARRRLETMLAALSWRQGCSARRCSRRSVRRLPGGRSLYLPAPALSQRRSASSRRSAVGSLCRRPCPWPGRLAWVRPSAAS
mmetsp:Transcript_79515/g.170416  ORF Transcript_79515/g.170416 Transcript_79515/m.170416 type:complete len:206 (+) Transcript_79515:1103-1720(+)